MGNNSGNGSGALNLASSITSLFGTLASGTLKIIGASKSGKVTADRYAAIDDNPTYDGTAANIAGIAAAVVIIIAAIILLIRK